MNKFKPDNTFIPNLLKGDYYSYTGKEKLSHLIYPLPTDSSLGVHATIDLGKGIRFGPSAYQVSDIDYSISETHKEFFLSSVRRYWPSIKKDELVPSYSGIRPLLINYDDFVLDKIDIDESFMVSILGYASPGLTSSLALAEKVDEIIN